MSRNSTRSPAEVNRSVTPPVGRPPDQTKPSIEPSFIASTVLPSSSRCGRTSVSGLSPAACSSRLAITSVPDFGDPVEIRLPRKSAIVVIPDDRWTTTWV